MATHRLPRADVARTHRCVALGQHARHPHTGRLGRPLPLVPMGCVCVWRHGLCIRPPLHTLACLLTCLLARSLATLPTARAPRAAAPADCAHDGDPTVCAVRVRGIAGCVDLWRSVLYFSFLCCCCGGCLAGAPPNPSFLSLLAVDRRLCEALVWAVFVFLPAGWPHTASCGGAVKVRSSVETGTATAWSGASSRIALGGAWRMAARVWCGTAPCASGWATCPPPRVPFGRELD